MQEEWIKVCMSSGGVAAGSEDVMAAVEDELAQRSLAVKALRKMGCIGCCHADPVVEVKPKGGKPTIYERVTPEQAREIVAQHFQGGQALESSTPTDEMFPHQVRIALRNCGIVDPECIDDYIAHDGYSGLRHLLADAGPAGVIEEMRLSGLRGRGGAGFPTWVKWNFANKKQADVKYMICNGDEGDPGAYMDRSIMESDPHGVVEGMILAGFAVGARQGYFYIRAEYPLAIERVQKAIDAARSYGFLGERILGTEFSYDLEIRLGAGAFVCGEETALIASIEGKRGTPRPRPPYPTDCGLWGHPTVINNVETLSNVTAILQRGGAWYGSIGTPESTGTKVFALTGKVKNSGLIEIPMGTTLREIVFDIGGGPISAKPFMAVQTGGPSGGLITKEHLDTPLTYENLQKLGSIMGSGGMIVIDEGDCVVDLAKFYIGFCAEESCGKCAPCRVGGKRMQEILEAISEGRAQMSDLDKLKKLAHAMQKASLCGLGQTAPNPVLSTIRQYAEEYRQHIEDRTCRARRCVALVKYQMELKKQKAAAAPAGAAS
ncbi:MAG: SLBB domain-containing protein [Vampirovibrionales bacterium]|nr:SLBB domain-containing protein [Vampirovibrionales bacterium]